MPKYFGHKGHNKQTWKFKKTHPQLRVFQKETQARIGFFDQIEQLVQKQRSLTITETLGGTPTTEPSTSMPLTATVAARTQAAKQTFGHRYPKAVMAQFPPNPQSVPPTEEQVMMVKNYIKSHFSEKHGQFCPRVTIFEIFLKLNPMKIKLVKIASKYKMNKNLSNDTQNVGLQEYLGLYKIFLKKF